MTDFETYKRVSGAELNGRMVYLTPSAEMVANLAREKKRSLFILRVTWGLYVGALAFAWWMVSR